MNIAEAVKAQTVREDKLYSAAECISRAKCLPQDTRDALIKHISDARAKHPAPEGSQEPPTPPVPATRPSKFAAAVGKVAKATEAKS